MYLLTISSTAYHYFSLHFSVIIFLYHLANKRRELRVQF